MQGTAASCRVLQQGTVASVLSTFSTSLAHKNQKVSKLHNPIYAYDIITITITITITIDYARVGLAYRPLGRAGPGWRGVGGSKLGGLGSYPGHRNKKTTVNSAWK